MQSIRWLAALVLTLPSAAGADTLQTDRYFALQPVGSPGSGEFVVRISESARAQAFVDAIRDGEPRRMTSRIVPRHSAWNLAWPFYTERHRLLPVSTLIARCPSHGPSEISQLLRKGAQIAGSAWCPAVTIVREIKQKPI